MTTPMILERIFKLSENGTTVRTEVAAGVTTFLTMAYIIFVNPTILQEAGVPFTGALFATCASAAIGSILMGLLANYPFALAPGMGLNAYFTYSVVKGLGYDWRVALGAVFVSGIAFLILTLVRVRAMIVDAIPMTMKTSVAAGIGLFIAFIGLKNAGVIAASPATFVTLGHVVSKSVVLALVGLLLTAALMVRGFRSAIIIGILVATVAWAAGSLYSRSAPQPRSLLLAIGMQMLVGGCAAMAAGALAGEWSQLNLAGVSAASWVAYFYLLIFATLITFPAYIWLLRVVPAARVSTYAYVNPVVALFLGWLVANEPLTSRSVAAAAMIVVSVVMVVSQSASKAAPAEPIGEH